MGIIMGIIANGNLWGLLLETWNSIEDLMKNDQCSMIYSIYMYLVGG
jgi:hypothetical protein